MSSEVRVSDWESGVGGIAYVQLIPAIDWFYVHSVESHAPSVYRIACWALTASGEIHAMVPVHTSGGRPKLVQIPDREGALKYVDRLSDHERRLAKGE